MAYNDANIASDLAMFDAKANLPTANLTVVNQTGGTTLPQSDPTGDGEWQAETSLDVEWTHATAPGANILLVEANSQSIYNNGGPGDLVLAVNYTRNQPNVDVVSMSFGQSENSIGSGELPLDQYFTTPAGHTGITFVAATGDMGSSRTPNYPSVSPNVLAVGGTSLPLDAFGNYPALPPPSTSNPYYGLETGWSGSGGGKSAVESEPAYQESVQQSNMREVPDVSYLADPGTSSAQIGVQIYDSTPLQGQTGFYDIGGTSAGRPMVRFHRSGRPGTWYAAERSVSDPSHALSKGAD